MATKPTVKEIEEYMASLNIPEEAIQEFVEYDKNYVSKGLNGMTHEDFDVISKPKHYMLFEKEGIEVRHVLEKLAGKVRMCIDTPDTPLFDSDYVQLMQYLMRFMDKNGVEDLKKARWYLDKMISSY